MDRILPRMLFFWFCIAILSGGAQGANENENAAEFNFLCHVAGLLLNADELKKSQAPALERIEKADGRIELINISLSDEDFFTNGREVAAEKAGDVPGDTRNKRWEEFKNKLADNVNKEGVEITRLSIHGATFSRRALRIAEKMAQLKNKAVEEKRNFETSRSKAVTNMKRALFGGEATAETTTALDTSFRDNYADACGAAEGAETVGKSLASDMLCLCGMAEAGIAGSADAGAKRCAETALVFTNNRHGYDDAAGGKHPKAIAAWGLMADQCRKRAGGSPTSENLLVAVHAFPGLIGKHYQPTNGLAFQSYVLGSYKKGDHNGCQGTATTDTCVNYKHQMSDEKRKVEWVANIEKAIDELHKLNASENALHQIERQAEHLDHMAIDLYLSAKGMHKTASTMPETDHANVTSKAGPEVVKDVAKLHGAATTEQTALSGAILQFSLVLLFYYLIIS